jgi:HK97 family phage prohead protease
MSAPTRHRRLVDGGAREARVIAAGLALSEVETNRGFTMMHGKAAPYGEIGRRFFFNEIWADGLFDESIAGLSAKLPLLIFHDDMTWPIGSATEWESKPGDGLYGTWLLDDSAEAQRTARLAADGHLNYLSVGYQPDLSEWDINDESDWDPADASTLDTVIRLKARLMETSVVPVPLHHSAQIMLVASQGGRPKRHRADPGRHGDATPKLDRWRDWRSSI